MRSPCQQREQLHDWPLSTCLELGALPSAVPCARLHARQVLWEWGLDSIADTIELLVSELVTNSVLASRAMPQRPPIWFRLSAAPGQVLIEVWDGSPELPQLPELEAGLPDLAAESGRGLFLVARLAERWDWYRSRGTRGKVVWCQLTIPRFEEPARIGASTSSPLPKRVPQTVPARPAQAMDNPDVLLRLRDGLLRLQRSEG